MKIDILTDNQDSWIVKFIPQLLDSLKHKHHVNHIFDIDLASGGDILCALSCERILSAKVLSKYLSTIVAHPSPLPKGKGWSPIAWQILDGINQIPVSLIEAHEKVDSGPIYLQESMILKGHDLNDEIKKVQFKITKKLVIEYISNFPMEGISQTGTESFYPKRVKKDNELDVNKTIAQQFNSLRVVDNKRYPAYFNYKGHKYFLKIEKSIK